MLGAAADLVDLGHLSNEDGADAMIRTLGNRTKKIYLGHLSKENNIKELAHMTMENQLARADLAVGHDFEVLDTSPDTATPDEDIRWKPPVGGFICLFEEIYI